MRKDPVRIYECSPCCAACPVADYDPESGSVRLFDPEKPENGSFTMTRAEWNALVRGARAVDEAGHSESAQ